MTFEFVGTHYPFGRVVTGYYSLDMALRGIKESAIGFPTRTLVEIFGPTASGKTTFSTSILSKISQAYNHLDIACLDLEQQDEDMINNTLTHTGYNASNFFWVNPPKSGGKVDDRDEKMLEVLLDYVNQETPCLGFLDSIASISPVSEVEGDIGDANMGRRAFPMAQFCRRAIRILRNLETPSCIIMTNHRYEKMQTIGMAKQYTAPGGNVKENEAQLRISVKVPWVDYITSGDGKKEARWEQGWVLEGRVEKNRAGAPDKTFQVFIYGGWGVHTGMTALIDCLASGLATIKSGKVILDDKDYGLLKKIVDRERDNAEFFIPFQNALRVPVDTESDSEEE